MRHGNLRAQKVIPEHRVSMVLDNRVLNNKEKGLIMHETRGLIEREACEAQSA